MPKPYVKRGLIIPSELCCNHSVATALHFIGTLKRLLLPHCVQQPWAQCIMYFEAISNLRADQENFRHKKHSFATM